MPRRFVPAALPLVLLGVLGVSLSAWAPIDVTGTARLADRVLGDAVVWLDAPNAPRPTRPAPARLDQRDLQFWPHVLVVQVGTKVLFPNDDRVFHNVFSFHDGTKFNLGLYPVGMVKDVPFNVAGLSRVFCNIHPQMAAYVMVVDTPYFAVSDAAGRFTIRGVPSGTYRYHAWRPGGAILNDTIDVGSSAPFEVRWP